MRRAALPALLLAACGGAAAPAPAVSPGLSVVDPAGPGVADGVTPAGVRVVVRDEGGAFLPGRLVTLAYGGVAEVSPAGGVLTDLDGAARFALVSAVPQSAPLVASVGPVVIAAQPPLEFRCAVGHHAEGAACVADPLGPAAVLLSELSPGVAGGLDLVELEVTAGGMLSGIRLQRSLGNPTPLAALPALAVAAGDLVLVHLGAPAGVVAETTGQGECLAAACAPGAWDVLGEPGVDLPFDDAVIALLGADGGLLDGAPFMRDLDASPTSTPVPWFGPDTRALQEAGRWLPASCPDGPCTSRTARLVAAAWDTVGSTPATSVARRPGAAGDQAADWAVGPSSFGAPNP